MSTKSEAVKRWRKKSKDRIVEAMGGKCVICNYNKSTSALSLHHLDPKKKELSFGSIRANPKCWGKIVKELRKCILVCNNCHSEIHEGITKIPENPTRFNEDFEEYRKLKYETVHPCPVCNKDIPEGQKYCSNVCSGKAHQRIEWDKIDLKKELENKSIVDLADELGCSDVAIHKRLRKLGLK